MQLLRGFGYFAATASILLDAPGVTAHPAGHTTDAASAISRRATQDFYLRVMPLGASITQGVASTDKNGYRKWLRSQLRWKGWNVNMVGSKHDGDMADDDNEGHPGWIIDQVYDEWLKYKGLNPNLVLINAGTNDCGGDVDTGNAGNRLRAMVDDIFNSLPDVTVIVSTLSKSRDHDACALDLSQQYRDLVSSYTDKRIGLADIDSVMTADQLASDGVHPNDEGYKLFAAVWWDAISKLEDQIQPPDDTQDDGAAQDDGEISDPGLPPYESG